MLPLLGVSADAGGGVLRIGLALVWGVGSLWAAWCWVLGQARSVAAPVVTGGLIWLALATG